MVQCKIRPPVTDMVVCRDRKMVLSMQKAFRPFCGV